MMQIDSTQMQNVVSEIQTEHADQELHWLISQVITPEFPQIIEALGICSNLILYNSPQHPDAQKQIERGPEIKLPVSSSKLEALKGIIVRDGAYVTQMTVQLKESHFNKILNKMTLKKPVLLPQIIRAKKSIDAAVGLIERASSEVLDDNCDQEHTRLIALFHQMLCEIQIAKNSLQLPTDPELVFPLNVTPASSFSPVLTPNIAVDLYISQAEVCVDLKYLHQVQDHPWCEIDSQGKSYVDKLRDDMRLPSSHVSRSLTPAAAQPLNMADIEQKIHQSASTTPDGLRSQSNFVNNVWNHILLKPKHDPIDYITKCVTYNNMVVMVGKKIEVSSPDPVLVSALTKLDSVEYLVSSFLENLQKVVDSLHQ